MPIRDQQKVRLPAVAGRFYSETALDLRLEMAEVEAALPPLSEVPGRLRGCILPHAGYMFSLRAAMETIRRAKGVNYRNAVLLGPSHYVGFRGLAGSGVDSWRTPFGDLPTASALAEKLAAAGNPLYAVNEAAHAKEHSLEVIFPLLQYFFGALPVLPLVVGQLRMEDLEPLAELLTGLDSPETLWVVSSDFTHYGANFGYQPEGAATTAAALNGRDREAAELAAVRDGRGFRQFLGRTGATICGAWPILLWLAVLEKIDPAGEIAGRVVAVTDSGKVSRDYAHVVGYASVSYEIKK